MSNFDLSIGSAFLHVSLYDIAKLQVGRKEKDDPHEVPPPFTIFQDTAFFSLAQAIPLTLDDARWSFPAFRQEQQWCPQQQALANQQLSTLLYYIYGFSSYETGFKLHRPFHRFVASARTLFPTELYVWLPQSEQIPAGIYHYDSLHHGLALIREGHYLDIFCRATDADLQDCLGILLFSSRFWKTAYKYINFAYRLCTQEAGLVISNALMVAGALGLGAHVHYQFLDRPLNQLLGFDADEESLFALVPLYSGASSADPGIRRLAMSGTAQTMLEDIPAIERTYKQTSSLNRQLCARLIELNRHIFLENTTEITTPDSSDGPDCTASEERVAAPAPSLAPVELARTLHRRRSGAILFTPVYMPLGLQEFWEVVRYALSEYTNDMSSQPVAPQLQLYLVVNNVTGLDQGIYRLCARCAMLHVVERGDFSAPFQDIQTQGNIVSISANLLCFMVGNYEAASRVFGNRAYRMLNMEAGIIGHRLSVMSTAQRLVARYSNSYEVASCRTLLRLDPALVPLAELVIGYEAPGAYASDGYQLSLRG